MNVLLLSWAVLAAPPPEGWVSGLRPRTPPARIVSLAPSVTESLFALGLGPRVVAVTRYCDRPAEAAALPRVGGFSDPSLEAVLAQKPDAVVAVPAELNRTVVERLVAVGTPVLLVPDTTVADVERAITLMGGELGVSQRAGALLAAQRARLSAVNARVKDLPRPRVLVLYDARPVVAAGPGSFADEVITLSGGTNVVARGPTPYPVLGLETVLSLQPDVILDASMGAGASSPVMDMLSTHASIPAVKNGRVVRLQPGVLARPGPALADDVETVERLLHAGNGARATVP